MRHFLTIILATITSTGFAQKSYLAVGTYTDKVHIYQFDAQDGTLKYISDLSGVENPSYLAFTSDFIYAVSEKDAGAVVAMSFNKDSGKLQLINKVPSGGADPCFIDVHRDWVVVANYSGGSFSLFKRGADGSLSEAIQTVKHSGGSVNKLRQGESHVHSARFSANGKQIWVNDLGTDKTYIYTFKNGVINIDKVFVIDATPGSGPRHTDYKGKVAYTIAEMSGTVDIVKGGMIIDQVDSGLASQNELVGVGSADIHLGRRGKFLYVSHRGSANAITIYKVTRGGLLTLIGTQNCGGENPRNFTISPNGHFMLVANGVSNNIAIFRINPKTGLLTPSNQSINVQRPVCLVNYFHFNK